MPSSDKTIFDKTQSVMTLITPILVVAIGAYLNQNITRVESEIKNVEAMQPYFDMMAGKDTGKAKMAAYALYMLNKEDPSMAVSMIMAPENPALMAVLIDLGSREPAIWEEVRKILATEDDTREQTDMQKRAQEIYEGIGSSGKVAATAELKGWSYLGDYGSGSKLDKRVWTTNGTVPVKGVKYELKLATNLRADKPQPPKYSLASITGVAKAGKFITIIELDEDKQGRVWAEVSVSGVSALEEPASEVSEPSP